MSEGVLVDFFAENRAEVIDLFLTEWDEEKYRDLLRREAEEDGYAAGEAEGRKEGRDEVRSEFLQKAAAQVRDGLLTLEDAARIFGFSTQEILALLEG